MDDEDVLFDRTSDSVEIISNTEEKMSRYAWNKINITVLLFLAFFTLGLYISIPGPTLLDLSEITHTNLSEISWLFTARSVGYLCGSLIGGLLFDCFNRLLLIGFSIILAGFSTGCIPWSTNLLHLVGLVIFQGISMGILDTGGNVVCLDTWQEDGGTGMQLLHFSFGFGAFIAPLIAEPFLVQHHQSTSKTNITSFTTNATLATANENSSDNSFITVAYMLIGSFGVIIGFAFLVFCLYDHKYGQSSSQAHTQKRHSKEKENVCFKMQILLMLALFFFFYVGSEVTYGAFISSVSVLMHAWSKPKAAFLASVFWGSFASGRFVSIFLTRILTDAQILVMDLTISTSSLILLSIFADSNEWILWMMTGTLGFGFAAIFPAGISWAEKYIKITGKAASIFVIGSAFGEMAIPVIAGHLIKYNNPMSFVYLLLFISCLSVSLFLFMLFVIRRHASAHISSTRRMEEDELPLTTNMTDDEGGALDTETPNADKKRHVTFNLSNVHAPNKNGAIKNSILKTKDTSKKD